LAPRKRRPEVTEEQKAEIKVRMMMMMMKMEYDIFYIHITTKVVRIFENYDITIVMMMMIRKRSIYSTLSRKGLLIIMNLK